jgi:hypothetical protein
VTIQLLSVPTRTLKVCWEVLRKVPVDWLSAWMAIVCEGSLAAVQCLDVWAMSRNGCERTLVTVHLLTASESIDTGCEMGLDAVHCLMALARTPRDCCVDLR